MFTIFYQESDVNSPKGVGMTEPVKDVNNPDLMLREALTLLTETLESVSVLSDQVESLRLNLEALTDEIYELNDQLEEVVF